MKDISSVESLVVPEDVTVSLKARTITVTGPRGTLVKKVGHIQMDIQLVSGGGQARHGMAILRGTWGRDRGGVGGGRGDGVQEYLETEGPDRIGDCWKVGAE
jgi:hypothetical protein